ncbi:MAG: SLC13 family permease [Desulfobacterales bacterium]|jgi:di/tricarboxylate transporter
MMIWLVTAILLMTLVLLVSDKAPVDLVALGIMVALTVTGVLDPKEAVAGFASPAVITVAAMFLMSRGMIRTGAVGFIGQQVIAMARGNHRLALLMSLLIVAAASAFINNTPVVVLFIPIMLAISCEYGLSPSKFLIPISYASILAGTCTLVGTSTNIIVSDLSVQAGFAPIGMFELASVGLPVAVVGILFLTLTASRLMPGHAAATCHIEDGENRTYLAELLLSDTSPLVGKASSALIDLHPSLEIVEVIRRSAIHYPDEAGLRLAPEDLMLVKCSASDLVAILAEGLAVLPYEETDPTITGGDPEHLIVELVVPPQSGMLGARVPDTSLFGDDEIQILAIKRRSHHYADLKIHTRRLRVGDILLVRSPLDKVERLRGEGDFIVIEDVHHEIVHKRLAGRALLIFGGVVTAAATGMLSIMVAAMAGVLAMILTGCLHLRTAYRELRADVLLLIVGTIALGQAMQKTGATDLYAHAFLQLFAGAGPTIVLGGFLLLTSVGTHILSNNATAVLLLPVAVSTAQSLGVDPRPFIIAVCFGASACFASPIGYQTNLMVYGPGNYQFVDYLKLGGPLNLIVIAAGTILIPMFWPF